MFVYLIGERIKSYAGSVPAVRPFNTKLLMLNKDGGFFYTLYAFQGVTSH